MIYSNDIKACNEFAQTSAVNLKRAALFVLATVQQQLETVPVALTDITEIGTASRFSWGSKKRGIEYLNENIRALFCDAKRFRNNPAQLMRVFLRIPGLGLVKSGFLCQIFAGLVGCIDTHNIKLYEIPLSALRLNYAAKPKSIEKKIAQYISLCEGLGGAYFLWSNWCDFVARLRPYNWQSGAEVSQFHLDVINGTETGAIVDLFSNIDFEPKFKQAA